MSLDLERIESKAAYIREQKGALERLVASRRRGQILGDPWTIKGMKYALQTMVEALIDIAFHVCAKDFQIAPVTGREAMEALVREDVIVAGDLDTFTAMIGFRNRIVHGYQEVTDERVYQFAAKELDDFDRFLRAVLRHAETSTSPPNGDS